MQNKYVCFHGHFYQPPRENPWLEEVEPQESALPYRDWNVRITQECYGPNAACPIPDGFGRPREMADNYRLISFNFGATLFSWLERHHPTLSRRVIEADAASVRERGHGNALAQPYVHAILPLQTLRDKRTMVRWGIEDFVYRFGRRPEGMWLPETAVDDETLEVLVEEGLRFTILAPSQAGQVRDVGAPDTAWAPPPDDRINTSRPYRWTSKSRPGGSLAVFFYYAELHEDCVRGEALSGPDGVPLLRKVRGRYYPDDSTQLVHTAVDGEFFGHHRPHGHQTLANALSRLVQSGVQAVNYAQFLDLYPPPQEVSIRERTAWSCPHGLGRWSEDCGCKIARDQASRQGWRRPLLEVMDWLKTRIDEVFEREGGRLLKDPWAARDAYVRRLLEGSSAATEEFLSRHGRKHLTPTEARTVLRLCEMQRHRLLMLTSCAWFFDDIAGLEAVQNLSSAVRAADLAAGFGEKLIDELKSRLGSAPSNDARYVHGAGVLERLVLPRRADLSRAAAHAAISRHLESHGGAGDAAKAAPSPSSPIEGTGGRSNSEGAVAGSACEGDARAVSMPRRFSLERLESSRWERRLTAGRDRALSTSRVELLDTTTLERIKAWAVTHQQDRLDLACWVRTQPPPAGLEARFRELDDAGFRIWLISELGEDYGGIDSLFAEERAVVMRVVLAAPPRSPLRLFLEGWRSALLRLGPKGESSDDIMRMMSECREHGLHVDQLPATHRIREHLRERAADTAAWTDPKSASTLLRWIETAQDCGFHLNLWELQDFSWRWLSRLRRERGPVSPVELEAAKLLARRLNFSEAVLETEHGDQKTAA